MLKDLKAADIIAIILIIGYFVILHSTDSNDMPPAFLLIIGYYFGHSAGTTTTAT